MSFGYSDTKTLEKISSNLDWIVRIIKYESDRKKEIADLRKELYGKKWKEGMSVPACANDCTFFEGNKLNNQKLIKQLIKAESNVKMIIDNFHLGEIGDKLKEAIEAAGEK